MAYSRFTLEKVKEIFSLEISEINNLFSHVEPIEISEQLSEILEFNVPLAVSIGTEKVRSELIIAPILVELVKMFDREISIFSGVKFNVDRKLGLNGICDFIICKSPTQLELSAPVIMLVEAKKEDLFRGIPQCIAEMYAAKIFNQRKKNQRTTIYGLVTAGDHWKFLKLENQTIFVDRKEYYADHFGKILAILQSFIDEKD